MSPPREQVGVATVTRDEKLLLITGAIADAVSSEQVYEALVDQVALAVEASSAALWLVDGGERIARLVRAVGYTEASQRSFEALPLDTQPGIPALDALRTREPLWFASQRALIERYPHLYASVTPGRSYRVSCLPLVASGRVLGVLGLTIEEAKEASEEERDFLLLVARYASQAVERLRLLDAERRSREQAQVLLHANAEARSRAERLSRFAQAVVTANTVEQVFEAALDALDAALGTQRSAVLVCDPAGVMRFRAFRHLSEEYRAAVEGHSPWPPDVVAPEPVLVADALHDPAWEAYVPLFRREGIGALAFIPLLARGRLLGKFMLYYAQPHAFSAADVELARTLANYLGSAIARFAAIAKLEETIRNNELFAGVLAHDLRNPLSAIVTAGQLMLMRYEDERAPETLDTKPVKKILGAAARSARMIDQLLDFTRARAGGGIEIDPREADLGDLCVQAIGELELAHPEWTIRRELAGDQRGTWDPDRLLQVISNLVGNAGQHGAAEAGIRVRSDGTDPASVRLEVHNHGVIPEALLPDIFDPFRSTRHGRYQSSGLGLGLFIVREIVRAHGGSIEVTSSASEGTKFSIQLPRQRQRASAPAVRTS